MRSRGVAGADVDGGVDADLFGFGPGVGDRPGQNDGEFGDAVAELDGFGRGIDEQGKGEGRCGAEADGVFDAAVCDEVLEVGAEQAEPDGVAGEAEFHCGSFADSMRSAP